MIVEVEHYAGSLAESSAPRSARNARQIWLEREGLLLRLSGADGLVGQGEASPLPAYSSDSLQDCDSALRSVSGAEASEALAQAEPKAIVDWVSQRIPESLPAARFALETALLDLLAQQRRVPLHALFRSPPPQSVALAALLATEPAERTLPHAVALFERGVRTFKLKLGQAGQFSRECELLGALRSHFGDSVRLRLDANRAFAPTSLVECLTTLSTFDPEYVEEPCAPEALFDRDRLPVRIALDETLAEPR
jgi:o-succinylbenzoate synthase